jgi:hypothetical protein
MTVTPAALADLAKVTIPRPGTLVTFLNTVFALNLRDLGETPASGSTTEDGSGSRNGSRPIATTATTASTAHDQQLGRRRRSSGEPASTNTTYRERWKQARARCRGGLTRVREGGGRGA